MKILFVMIFQHSFGRRLQKCMERLKTLLIWNVYLSIALLFFQLKLLTQPVVEFYFFYGHNVHSFSKPKEIEKLWGFGNLKRNDD